MRIFPVSNQKNKKSFGITKLKLGNDKPLLRKVFSKKDLAELRSEIQGLKPEIGKDIRVLVNCWEEGKELGLSFIAQHDILSRLLPFRNSIVETYNIKKHGEKFSLEKAEKAIKGLVRKVTESRLNKIRLKRGHPRLKTA